MEDGMTWSIGNWTLTEAEVLKRLAYHEITEYDIERLREVHGHLQANSGEIIDRFYTYLLNHEHTRSMLQVPGLVERLKRLQIDYFHRLTAGLYDVAYFEDRLRVGQTHDRVGLSPEWYIGAYNTYQGIVSDVLSRAFGRDLERFYRAMRSLTKVISLDMSLAIDAYILSAQERLKSESEALARANEDLMRARSAKAQLTDMIVHDLQNPLSGIRAFLQFLESRRRDLGDSAAEALDEAPRRCDDLGQMIMNVLQVSRADAGKLEVYLENLDLAQLASECAAAFRLPAESEGQPISTESPGAVPIRSDQSLLRRILSNLIRNALRHTPRGTGIIVRVERGPARVSVIDDGPGIKPDVQAILFEPFGAPALRHAGLRVDSGLGLAFCKVAVTALGGGIAVRSDGRRGSTFTVTFPESGERPA
jgi:signal transduction histidine kinase